MKSAIIERDNFKIRSLIEQDIAILTKWLSDIAILEFYGGRDKPYNLESVKAKFFSGQDTHIQRCIVEYNDIPIGFVQFYPLEDTEKGKYGYPLEQQVYGMDQFIGEPQYQGKGLGTQLIRLVIEYITQELKIPTIIMDPRVDNVRAIHVYEKCGFRKIKVLPKHELHEGVQQDCWLMEYTTQTT